MVQCPDLSAMYGPYLSDSSRLRSRSFLPWLKQPPSSGRYVKPTTLERLRTERPSVPIARAMQTYLAFEERGREILSSFNTSDFVQFRL
jgi:hypothetical protein